MDAPPAMTVARALRTDRLRFGKARENSAICTTTRRLAAFAQSKELPFESLKLSKLLANMFDVLIEDRVHLGAIRLRSISNS
jgi:hypothetical protein